MVAESIQTLPALKHMHAWVLAYPNAMREGRRNAGPWREGRAAKTKDKGMAEDFPLLSE